ncbi:MAG: hypothetical protein JWN18_28 [Parcubacteria group bacterium]|nr:hypothetical protein [Parcubacteria group bacterium]
MSRTEFVLMALLVSGLTSLFPHVAGAQSASQTSCGWVLTSPRSPPFCDAVAVEIPDCSLAEVGTSAGTANGHFYPSDPCNGTYQCRCTTTTVNCSAAPVASGGNTTVTWSSTNAYNNSCSINFYGSGLPSSGTTASIGPVTSSIDRSVTCNGPGGNPTCPLTITPTAPAATGSITTPNSCTILANQSSCLMNVVWSTSNTTGTVTIKRPYAGNSVFASGASGNSPAAWSPPGTYNLDLYDGSAYLNTGVFTASCTSGTSWNGSICAAPASGSITPNSCTIAANANSCTMSVAWTSSNTSGTVTVQRAYAGNSVFATGISGNNAATWSPPGTYHMDLYDGSTKLGSGADFVVSCTSGTSWNGSICVGPSVNVYFN